MSDSTDDRYTDDRISSNLPAENRSRDASFDDDDLAERIVKPTPFPPLMLVTAILWILAGGAYIALFALARLVRVPFQGHDLWLLIGAVFFIKDGVQLIRGQFRDPFGDGVVTIVLGIYFLGRGYVHFEQAGNIVALIFDAFFGIIFLVPGILVLIGRKQFLAWKAEQGI